jgi:hypothetical protein
LREPLLLGAELDELLPRCTPLLLLVLIEPAFVLVAAPDGSLMLLRPLVEPVAPWSLLPLQPTNKSAAPANANSFFIMVTFLLQTVSSPRPLLNR